jgi:hypothetical protein
MAASQSRTKLENAAGPKSRLVCNFSLVATTGAIVGKLLPDFTIDRQVTKDLSS